MSELINIIYKVLITFFFSFMIVCTLILIFCLSSCTLSFTNISTHGTATDVVEEDQGASANVSPKISVPTI